MKIFIAKGSGFCFGVKRAIEMAYEHVNKSKRGRIYSLREIIHNPQEVDRLEKAGAKHIEKIKDIKKGSSVIVSTHGVSPGEENELKKKKLKILDTTCPYVKKIHTIVKRLTDENYKVIIVGDKEHLEVRGILGYTNRKGTVVSRKSDIKRIKFSRKTGVVSQTTQNIDRFRDLIGAIEEKVLINGHIELRIFNTICNATQKRQEATIELAKKVDTMVIIGGRNSANTRRLYQLSREILKDVHYIETKEELKKAWFKNKKTTGISAGASTPERIVKEVADRIKKMGER